MGMGWVIGVRGAFIYRSTRKRIHTMEQTSKWVRAKGAGVDWGLYVILDGVQYANILHIETKTIHDSHGGV